MGCVRKAYTMTTQPHAGLSHSSHRSQNIPVQQPRLDHQVIFLNERWFSFFEYGNWDYGPHLIFVLLQRRSLKIRVTVSKHTCVKDGGWEHNTSSTTKCHTGSIWLNLMESTCFSYFKIMVTEDIMMHNLLLSTEKEKTCKQCSQYISTPLIHGYDLKCSYFCTCNFQMLINTQSFSFWIATHFRLLGFKRQGSYSANSE